MIKTLLIILLFISSQALYSELSKENELKIDAIFDTWNKPSSPGAAVGVIQDGKLIYSKGFGIADLEHDVPITSSSVFYMASVSKHFVTMGILLLVEEGKIDLDVEIQEYLPDFPRYDSPLTIRHFIHHTSGVRDYLTLWGLAGNDYLDHISEEAVYNIIKNQKSLNFKPGTKYLYSNSCYFMLAMIIEKVSGMDINEFGEKYLFKPLGMNNSHFHNDVNHIIKDRVSSYRPNNNDGYDNLIMRFDLVGSGGLYSNVEDMYLWDQNFDNNILGKASQSLIEDMHKEGLLNNGESTNYAFGLSNSSYKGLKTVGHGGSLAGYRTHYLRFPEHKTSIVILANVGNFNSRSAATKVADVILSDVLEVEQIADEVQSMDAITISNKLRESYVGTYVMRPGIELEVSIKDNSLSVKQSWNGNTYSISPISNNMFTITDNTDIKFEFIDISEGLSQNLVVDQSGNKTNAERKRELPEANLVEYIGNYYSDELNTTYELYIEEDELSLRINYNTPLVLSQSGIDQFAAQGATLNFQRSEGQVNSFIIDAGRVTGINFIKK